MSESGLKVFKSSEELFQEIWEEIQQRQMGSITGLKELIEKLINHIMQKERELYLERHPEDRANGYYERSLTLNFGKFGLKVPRVRIGSSFRPSILPPAWKRVNKDYEELLLGLLSNGYSRAQIKQTLKQLGMDYSEEALKNVVEMVKERLDYFRQRTFKGDWLSIFIDAYHGKMRVDGGNVVDVSIFVAVGIDLEGYKHLIGFWVLRGRETKGFWTEVLQDMINRGIHRVLLFVTDDFSGLRSVIKGLFPFSEHQLCVTHLRRNLKGKLKKELYRRVRELLQKLRVAEDEAEGRELMEEVLKVVSEQSEQYAKRLRSKIDNYIAFLKYPRQIRGHLYTTNPVEGLNAGIDLMRLELGGYFPSRQCVEVNLFIQAVNLEDRWLRKPMPKVASCVYEIRQLFQLRYGLNEDDMEE